MTKVIHPVVPHELECAHKVSYGGFNTIRTWFCFFELFPYMHKNLPATFSQANSQLTGADNGRSRLSATSKSLGCTACTASFSGLVEPDCYTGGNSSSKTVGKVVY